jgi:transposase
MLALDDMIADDHAVRNVWKFVDHLDLRAFYHDIDAVVGGPGRDAVDPKMLLALWLWATIDGVGSARRLAELCERDFVYCWLCGGVGVNRDLLAKFRTDHQQALEDLLVESVATLLNQDLVSLNRVAQDGMRVRASAGKDSFHRQATIEEHLRQAKQQVETLRGEQDGDAQGNDEQDGAREGDADPGHKRRQAAQRRAAEDRQKRIELALIEREKLQAQKAKQPRNADVEARASTTDPEARVMKMGDGGFRPAFNVQFVTACDSRIIVGVDVTNEGSDNGQMSPMIEQLERNFGAKPKEYLVDGGFNSRDDTTCVEQRDIAVYAPVKSEKKLLAEGKDPYARRPGDTDEYYAHRQRMKSEEAKEIYKQRCSTAEFPNAGCRNRGLHQFPVRGQKKVKCIALWHALVHNLKMIVHHGWLATVCGDQPSDQGSGDLAAA